MDRDIPEHWPTRESCFDIVPRQSRLFFDECARAYTEGDVEGVTSLCHWPLLAVLAADAEKWTPLEIDTRQLGEHAGFEIVHWNALDVDGQVVRDTWTSYQLLATPDGWRFLSYTNTSEPQQHSNRESPRPSSV